MNRKDYLTRRRTRRITLYGLCRRTEMVIQQLQRLDLPKPYILVDIGTADGQILSRVLECRGLDRCIAVVADLNFRYLSAARARNLHVFQADGKSLPLSTGSTDVILSTSVFKHVTDLEKLISECHRVLKMTGKMIAIDPTPLGVRLGRRLGYFSAQEISQVLDLESTQSTLMALGFKVLRAERFMLSPIPFRGCDTVERALTHSRMDRLFLYQVVCAEWGCSN